MAYQLRDYQLKGKQMISRAFAQGHKKVMLWVMTGSGKGFQMSDFNDTAINAKQKVLNVMKRRAIIFQTIENYAKYHSLKASPIMGTVKGHDSNNFCQVASIDTLRTRIKAGAYDFLKQFDLIIIDECHDLTSKSYKMLIWFLEGYEIEFYSDKNFEKCKSSFKKYYIGLTATPFRVGNQAHTFWDVVVKPIEAHELRDMGVLVKTREFQPFTIDVKGIRLNRNGEFNQEELFERCTQMGVTGDVVKTYKKYGIINGRRLPAMYFCVNKLHAKIQTQAFNDAGISARYCNDSHSQKERDRAKADLKSGIISILLNVDLFSTGFDAPFIELGGFLRPTESENLACQQWGRILRPYKICSYCSTEYGGDPTCFKCGSNELKYEKQFAIMLDHAGNMSRHPGKQMIGNSVVYAIREAELNQRDIDHKIEQIGNKPKECPECDGVLFPSATECEYCGYVYGENDGEFTVLERDGELVEADAEFLREQLKAKIIARFNGYQTAQFTRRWDNTIKYFKIYDDFGDDIFMLRFKLGITPLYEKVLRKKGEQRREKELNDNVNKLLKNLNYTNKAVVND